MPALSLVNEDLARLAERLREVGYTVDAVVTAVGKDNHGALARNATVAAERALAERDDPLATLVRLWLLQRPVPTAAAEHALGPSLDALLAAGVLEGSGATVSAASDLRPYASDDAATGETVNGWVFADLTPGLDGGRVRLRSDYVLGVSSASTTLAQIVPRRPVGSALDLGTGCGVQSLHLARHCERVVATDVNPRALAMAGLTARINETELDLRPGSLYAPVSGERFDLIVSNPPYVISPPGGRRLTYRESTLAGDELVRRVVTEGAAHLAPHGRLQVLANWAHVTGKPWDQRIHDWVAPTGCDAYVVQREVLDPAEYVELWLADAGLLGSDGYRTAYAQWLDYFAALGIEAVGMGWLSLRAAGRADPYVEIADWPWPVEQPLGRAYAARDDALDLLLQLSDQEILARRWRLAPDVVQETTGRPGAADFEHVVLRQTRGFRHAEPVDTALGGVMGACDGELPLAAIVAAVAHLTQCAASELTSAALSEVRQFVVSGLLSCVE